MRKRRSCWEPRISLASGASTASVPRDFLLKPLIPKSMIDKELLEILVCPETGEPLEEAGREIVARLNELVELGTLVDRSGARVSGKIEAGLLCRGGKHFYPVKGNIPILLIESSIPIA